MRVQSHLFIDSTFDEQTSEKHIKPGPQEMALWVKVLTVKPEDRGSIIQAGLVEGASLFLQAALDSHMQAMAYPLLCN